MKAKLRTLFTIVLGVVLVACESKDDFTEAMDLLGQLEKELMTCTVREKFDVVHEKITSLDENRLFQSNTNTTKEQNAIIVNKTLSLGFKAFAVMDILKVADDKYKITEVDMKVLVEQYLAKMDAGNRGRLEFDEVKGLLEAHYSGL